jgi:hypothetical protein
MSGGVRTQSHWSTMPGILRRSETLCKRSSRICGSIRRLGKQPNPARRRDLVSFVLAGPPLLAVSAGPFVKFNPSVSFHVRCSTKQEVDAIWDNGLGAERSSGPSTRTSSANVTDGSKTRQASQHLLHPACERRIATKPAITARRAGAENRRNRESFSAPC